MNADVTVRDVMSHEFVGVSESDDVRSTAALMLAEDVDCVVVLRGREPVGLLTEREVLSVIADGDSPAETTVGSVMREAAESIEPTAGLAAALDIMATADERRLLVDDGELRGLLTEHDLLAATALERYEEPEGAARVALNGSEPPYETATFDETAEPDLAISDQSICQECGALARDLAEVDGQMLCADCRDV
ncbi:CBS domain-containing protein [Salinirubellus salinus]|uniref:CBS domain-containing protein n=1 Tax=Salinirubellus salinus TaxID=1364945 RepID=A0A9E7R5Y7_9EURY|nr:CBS domain-containing protein [Salinirubellus salinus]UWM56066.1 CBS domain-containing protein [Salinirubellus salinus]